MEASWAAWLFKAKGIATKKREIFCGKDKIKVETKVDRKRVGLRGKGERRSEAQERRRLVGRASGMWPLSRSHKSKKPTSNSKLNTTPNNTHAGN